MAVMTEIGTQAVTGLTPPGVGEAVIRDAWPGVASVPAAANFAMRMYHTVFLAPLGWLVLTPFLLKRIAGFVPGFSGLVTRYRLTNKRLMVCKGPKAKPIQEVALDRIKDVRLKSDATSEYFFAGDLEIVGADGTVYLRLPGVREAESFRHAILESAAAFGPLIAR